MNEFDDDEPAIRRQLSRAVAAWRQISKVLSTQRTSMHIRTTFYRTVVQAVLLYGAETWATSKTKLRKLNSFHNRVTRHITGEHIKLVGETYIIPDMNQLRKKAGLLTIEEYIMRRREYIWDYLEGRQILERCRASPPNFTSVNQVVWWGLPRTHQGRGDPSTEDPDP